MKIVHKQEDSVADMINMAKKAESASDWPEAEKLYQRIIKRDPNNSVPYNRLMIVYRKQKMYEEELNILTKAITHFTGFYSPKTAHSKTVKNLSSKINKAFGMVDKKGNSLYDPGPVAAWKRRKTLMEKRVKK